MSHQDQIDALYSDFSKLIDRYRLEFEMPYASVLGILQILSIELAKEALDNED